MTDGPTPRQTLFLWAAIAQGGAAPAKDLKPELDKKDRDALVRHRLIAINKVGRYRAVHIEVTDHGWAWAAANMAAPLPKTGAAGGLVLHHLLSRLGVFLQHSGASLAELMSPPPVPSRSDPDGIPDHLRAAYLAETGGAFGRGVRLATLRERLSDTPRAALDAALVHLASQRRAVLMPIEFPPDIQPADVAAAITQGGSARHLLILDP